MSVDRVDHRHHIDRRAPGDERLVPLTARQAAILSGLMSGVLNGTIARDELRPVEDFLSALEAGDDPHVRFSRSAEDAFAEIEQIALRTWMGHFDSRQDRIAAALDQIAAARRDKDRAGSLSGEPARSPADREHAIGVAERRLEAAVVRARRVGASLEQIEHTP